MSSITTPAEEPKQTKIKVFEARILTKYELTIIEYSELYRTQEGKCAICQVQFSNENPSNIDHNHHTGKVRGLLCGNCNKGIGFLRDSIPYLEKAIEYLKPYDTQYINNLIKKSAKLKEEIERLRNENERLRNEKKVIRSIFEILMYNEKIKDDDLSIFPTKYTNLDSKTFQC